MPSGDAKKRANSLTAVVEDDAVVVVVVVEAAEVEIVVVLVDVVDESVPLLLLLLNFRASSGVDSETRTKSCRSTIANSRTASGTSSGS